MQSERAATFFGDKEDPRRRLQALGFGEPPSADHVGRLASIYETVRWRPSRAAPQPAAQQWATTVLDEAGIDLESANRRWSNSKIYAIRALQKAEPGLTTKTAIYLARNLQQ